MTDASPSFARRLWLAFECFFRVLLNASFARRVGLLDAGTVPPQSDMATHVAISPAQVNAPAPPPPNHDPALGLLAIFQREGRLIDFLQQEIDAFSDGEVGAAARVVHGGCRRALCAHFALARVRLEAEGTTVTVVASDVSTVKLTGNVQGSGPYRGVLRHAGWRVQETRLPEMVEGHDASVVCPAEVEL